MKTIRINLINDELKTTFRTIGQQEEATDPMVIAKFFNPCGAQTWYAISYDESSNCCFGYVTGFNVNELGYFSIDELESLSLPYGLSIERDLYFTPALLSEIKTRLP